MNIYVISTDSNTGKYTAFCEGGGPRATSYVSKEEAVGMLVMECPDLGFRVIDVDRAEHQ